jgi:hypothetical protein
VDQNQKARGVYRAVSSKQERKQFTQHRKSEPPETGPQIYRKIPDIKKHDQKSAGSSTVVGGSEENRKKNQV